MSFALDVLLVGLSAVILIANWVRCVIKTTWLAQVHIPVPLEDSTIEAARKVGASSEFVASLFSSHQARV